MYYILEGKNPVACSAEVWSAWFEKARDSGEKLGNFNRSDRHVALDQIGDVVVSTVFLGLDHGFLQGAPILFETMIFGGEHDGAQERYRTWD